MQEQSGPADRKRFAEVPHVRDIDGDDSDYHMFNIW